MPHEINFNDIPDWWALCQNADCPLSDSCLRHQALLQVPARVTKWLCVLPTAWRNGDCQYYRKAEAVRMAQGFAGIYNSLKSRDARHDIRLALTDYFGSKGSYYRYRDGDRLLTPQQQQWIRTLLLRYGYAEGIEFDNYVITYDFSTV